jgi:acyl-CoA thioesterase
VTNRFDRDTAIEPLGEGRYAACIDRGWWVVAGPNGGYLAAIVVRAFGDLVADPTRALRSLNIHYLDVPVEGPAVVETRIERRGGAMTTLSGRLLQRDKLVAIALAAFSKSRSRSVEIPAPQMPEVAPPDRCERMEPGIEIHRRYEVRWALGSRPLSQGGQALCGGWIRPAEPRIVDGPMAAAFCDAMPPAIFSHVAPGSIMGGVPTVDLNVHFRSALPLEAARPEDYHLAVFRSRVAREGFVEEDGELWTEDGQLVVQSRQLALAR